MGMVKWFTATVPSNRQLTALLQLHGDTESPEMPSYASFARLSLHGPLGPSIYSGLAGQDCLEIATEDAAEFRRLLAESLEKFESVSFPIHTGGRYDGVHCILSDRCITFYNGGAGSDPDRELADFEQDMVKLLAALDIEIDTHESELIG